MDIETRVREASAASHAAGIRMDFDGVRPDPAIRAELHAAHAALCRETAEKYPERSAHWMSCAEAWESGQ